MDTFDAGLKTGLGVGHDAVLLMVVWMMMICETGGALCYVPASWHKRM